MYGGWIERIRPLYGGNRKIGVRICGGFTVADLSNLELSTSIKPIFSVPFERDKQFIGREDIIAQIEEQFRTQHRVSLYGLGGIG